MSGVTRVTVAGLMAHGMHCARREYLRPMITRAIMLTSGPGAMRMSTRQPRFGQRSERHLADRVRACRSMVRMRGVVLQGVTGCLGALSWTRMGELR